MTSLKRNRFWAFGSATTVAAVGIIAGFSWANQGAKAPSADTLLPANTVLYFRQDGGLQHEEAWKKTAAYEAFYGSGLAELVDHALDFIQEREGMEPVKEARDAVQLISDHGCTGAVSIPREGGPPLPQITLVFHNAGKLAERLSELAEMAAAQEPDLEITKQTISGRMVTSTVIPDSPGVEVAFWDEGGHLLIAAGINATKSALAVATGDAPNVTTNATYKKYTNGNPDFEQTSLTWFELGSLREIYGPMALPLPIEEQLTVNDVLKVIGIDTLGTWSMRSGYKGEAGWNTAKLEWPGAAKSFFSEDIKPTMTFDELPPLPAGTNGFVAQKFDAGKFYDNALGFIRNVSRFAPPDAQEELEGGLSRVKEMIGFDPKADLISHLGDIMCVYADPDGGIYGLGGGIAIKVKNADKLKATLKGIAERLENMDDSPVYPFISEKYGRFIMTFEFFVDDAALQLGGIAIDDDWMVIGVMPQTTYAFLLRLDGKLPKWEPSEEYKAALADLPEEFSMITAVETRATFRVLYNWLNIIMPFAQTAIYDSGVLGDEEELPFHVEDLPPGELVAAPLFPNLSVSVVGENDVQWMSRTSTYGMPLVGSGGDASSVATVATLSALLLPAVQQAREAARRTASKNNLKQQALAMHNYYDTFSTFPPGTVAGTKFKPEERLSFFYELLPFLEQGALYEQMDRTQKWNAGPNDGSAKVAIPSLINPGHVGGPMTKSGYAATHYAGITGIGKDTGKGNPDRNSGLWGYDRKLRFRDITDGTSNTIMFMEVKKDIGPWAQGGKSTARPLTKKPYINGPDGFGSYFKGGCNAALTDGSVHFISENIDPEVLENMVKYNDGNPIGDF